MRDTTLWTVILTGLFTLPAAGVIRHPADDAVTFDTPNPAVVGLWANTASAVAIGPNHILTTRHQSGDVGTTVSFDGIAYKAAEIHNIGIVDLRVVRIETLANTPADLTHWVNVFDGNDDVYEDFVMGGHGRIRAADLTTTNGTYGYAWGAGPTAAPQWGQNQIEGANLIAAGSYSSVVLRADFDRPGAGRPAEAILSEFDSGGGWFVWTGTEWQVRALSAYLDHVGDNEELAGNRALFGSQFDANVNAQDLMFGIRLAVYRNEIYQVIPEPSSALLLMMGASSLMIRRRTNA